MKIILSVIISALLLFPALHAKQQSFLCSAEESTGYDYTNGRWLRERFRPDARYLVKQHDANWTVYEYEIEHEHTQCTQESPAIIRCSVSGDFILNIDTEKFSVTNTESYVHSTKRNRDAVILTLGTCVSM